MFFIQFSPPRLVPPPAMPASCCKPERGGDGSFCFLPSRNASRPPLITPRAKKKKAAQLFIVQQLICHAWLPKNRGASLLVAGSVPGAPGTEAMLP